MNSKNPNDTLNRRKYKKDKKKKKKGKIRRKQTYIKTRIKNENRSINTKTEQQIKITSLLLCTLYNKKEKTLPHSMTIIMPWLHKTLCFIMELTHSIIEPCGPCTKSTAISESHSDS